MNELMEVNFNFLKEAENFTIQENKILSLALPTIPTFFLKEDSFYHLLTLCDFVYGYYLSDSNYDDSNVLEMFKTECPHLDETLSSLLFVQLEGIEEE